MVVPAGGYAVPTDEEILKFAAEIAPDAEAIRLGGWMSVNFHLRRPAPAANTGTAVLGPADNVAAVASPPASATAPGEGRSSGGASAGGSASTEADGEAVRACAADAAGDGLVLHVHPQYVTRRRLRAVQHLRQVLSASGVTVPLALPYRGSTIIPCGASLAEIERFLPNEQLTPSWSAYRWLYRAMGTLHRVLATVDAELPRPLFTHYAAAGTLRSWIPPTKAAASGSAVATATAEQLDLVTKRIRNRWVPPRQLPSQLVHGDMKLENVLRAPNSGSTIYLDFGHAARRPRIHDLAFALTHTVITVDGDVPTDPARFPWEQVPPLVEEYQAAAGWRLNAAERRALAPYTAAVRLYFACAAWHQAQDPIDWLGNQGTSLALSQWLLDHPDALLPT
jgi:Ser/Thr protein kinase RdoA (MazF antagonist)